MIEKFQQGGQLDQIFNAINSQPEQALQQLIQSGAKPEDIVKIVQAGVQQGKIKPEIGQAILQAMQGQKVAARHGIKLNYVKSLKNKCAEDEEVVYYKKGGSVKCGCKKKEKGGEVTKAESGWKARKNNTGPITQFNPSWKTQKSTSESKFKNDYSSKRVKDSEKDYFNGVADNRKPGTEVVNSTQKISNKRTKAEQDKINKQSEDDYFAGTADHTKPGTKKVSKKACGSKIKKDCNGAVAKFKIACGSKLKKHQQGGSLNGIPFYQGGTSKGGIEKSDYTRVQRIPNDEEGVYEQIPINGWDFVPLVGTYREAQRLDQGDPNASKLGFATSMGMDLLGAGMMWPVIKATAKASRLSKLLKSRGFNKITEQGLYRSQPNTYMKVAPETIKHQYYNVTQPTVRFKQVPTVDVSGIALSPLVQTLRVPIQTMAH